MATNPSLGLWRGLGAVHPLAAWSRQYNLNRRKGTAGNLPKRPGTILSTFGMRLPDPRVFCPHSAPGCLDWSSDRSDRAIPRGLWRSCRNLARALDRFSLSMEPSSQQIWDPLPKCFRFVMFNHACPHYNVSLAFRSCGGRPHSWKNENFFLSHSPV